MKIKILELRNGYIIKHDKTTIALESIVKEAPAESRMVYTDLRKRMFETVNSIMLLERQTRVGRKIKFKIEWKIEK